VNLIVRVLLIILFITVLGLCLRLLSLWFGLEFVCGVLLIV